LSAVASGIVGSSRGTHRKWPAQGLPGPKPLCSRSPSHLPRLMPHLEPRPTTNLAKELSRGFAGSAWRGISGPCTRQARLLKEPETAECRCAYQRLACYRAH
jgi:hypothetical protein